jgi:hypothetical protein
MAVGVCGGHYTVPARSARIAALTRMMRAKMIRPRPNQKAGNDTPRRWASGPS